MSGLFEQLVGGLAVIDAWPSPKPREDYTINLINKQYELLWSFIWRNLSVRALPEEVSEDAAQHAM
jgi:hypothetical protein